MRQVHNFHFVFVVVKFRRTPWQELAQSIQGFAGKFAIRRELDRKVHVQISAHKRIATARHAFVGDDLDKGLIGSPESRNDFAGLGLHDDLALIQMRQGKGKSCQRFVERQCLVDQQVCALALEGVMFSFLDDKVDVPGFASGFIVSQALKDNLLTMSHALFHQDFDNLAFLVASHGASGSLAGRTMALDLLDHAQSETANLQYNPMSIARLAFGRGSDNHGAIDGHFDCLAIVQVFQRQIERMVNIFTATRSPRSATAAAPKENIKNIRCLGTATTAFLQPLEAVLIIGFSLFFIFQNLVSGANFLKDLFIASFIRMMLYR
mmetsp:Transcript_19905/g.37742  ORF Transcript_19905/g.37742 Transcript_19905/m.37742 type:complete len:322 (-) Transcript_19905:181-1146(-)